jgi:putative ATPase
LAIPLKVRNAPTKLMKSLDYHKGYVMYPKDPGSKEDSYLPEKLKGKKYLKRNSKGSLRH